jgi:hypothetical protein
MNQKGAAKLLAYADAGVLDCKTQRCVALKLRCFFDYQVN